MIPCNIWPVPFDMSRFATLDRLLYPLFVLAIAAYLICGAPHFVKWQVKKTLQQCSDTERTE